LRQRDPHDIQIPSGSTFARSVCSSLSDHFRDFATQQPATDWTDSLRQRHVFAGEVVPLAACERALRKRGQGPQAIRASLSLVRQTGE
jgi:hypothetical protein